MRFKPEELKVLIKYSKEGCRRNPNLEFIQACHTTDCPFKEKWGSKYKCALNPDSTTYESFLHMKEIAREHLKALIEGYDEVIH